MATSEYPLPLLAGIRDYTAAPGISWFDARYCLLFDGTTDELVTWQFRMPSDYAYGLTVRWQYSMVSATTGVVKIRSQVMAVADGVNIDTHSYATLDASPDVTVPSTAGTMNEIIFVLSNVDSIAGGSYVSIQLGRENATTGTNAAGDMEVWAVSLTYTIT